MATKQVIPMRAEHAEAVLRIYQAGIDTGDVTFETTAPDWETFDRVHLAALITSAEQAGVWTIQSGIFPENIASLTVHRRAGFRTVGVRERIGQRDGRWRDVHMIERRSTTVATPSRARPEPR